MTGQRCAVPGEILAAIFMPVSQYPAFDVNAVDNVLMCCRLMRMAMNEGGVAVGAQEIVGIARIEIHQVGRFTLFVGFALRADMRRDGPALGQRFCQKTLLPLRVAYLATEILIFLVVGT